MQIRLTNHSLSISQQDRFRWKQKPFYIKMSGSDIASQIIDDLLVNLFNNHDSIPNQYFILEIMIAN